MEWDNDAGGDVDGGSYGDNVDKSCEQARAEVPRKRRCGNTGWIRSLARSPVVYLFCPLLFASLCPCSVYCWNDQ